MIIGAILAGGTGSRMGSTSLPKQFLDLGDKPIIIHTLQKFLLNVQFDFIYLGIHENWIEYMNDLINKYAIACKNKIKVVSGGKDRNSTILNIIYEVEKENKLEKDDIIVTHDAVRPFVTSRIIRENIECAINFGACDTVIPAIDTIVISKDTTTIAEIPNRSFMYQGQTPQSFRILELKELYNSLTENEKEILTDACKIYTLKNKRVNLVKGELFNLKITTQDDYKIAQSLIKFGMIDD